MIKIRGLAIAVCLIANAATTVGQDKSKSIGVDVDRVQSSAAGIFGNGNRSILWAPEDVHSWLRVYDPPGRVIRKVVGGSAQKLLVLTQPEDHLTADGNTESDFTLEAVDIRGDFTHVADGVGARCGFYDDKIGAEVKNGALWTTLDGGKSWKRSAIEIAPLNVVSMIRWADAAQCYVSENDGHLMSIRMADGAPKLAWSGGLGEPMMDIAFTADACICPLQHKISVISKADGTEKTHVEMRDASVSFLSLCSQKVYAWDDSATWTWHFKGNSLTARDSFPLGVVAGIRELGDVPFAVTEDGAVYILDGDHPVRIDVTVKEIGVRPGSQTLKETPEEHQKMYIVGLMMQLPQAQVKRIIASVPPTSTNQQRLDWLQRTFEAALAKQKAGAATQP